MPPTLTMNVLGRIVNAIAIICGWALLGLCALTGYDIVARRLFGHSVQGVDEIGGYVLAVSAAVGFAAALLNRMHTRIDLFLVRMPARAAAVLNTVAAWALAGFAVFMLQKATMTFLETLEFGARASTPLQTPLWIPQAAWLFGIGLFATVSCAMAIHAAILLIRGQVAEANTRYGPPTLDEETEASLSAVGPLHAMPGEGK